MGKGAGIKASGGEGLSPQIATDNILNKIFAGTAATDARFDAHSENGMAIIGTAHGACVSFFLL
jgi:hypothetical protein